MTGVIGEWGAIVYGVFGLFSVIKMLQEFSVKGDLEIFLLCTNFTLAFTIKSLPNGFNPKILLQERGMEITEITVTLRNEEKLKAFVNVTFENKFVVRGMKVIKGANGYFVSMPSRKMPDGSFRDIAHPINNDYRQFIEKVILDEYYRAIERGQQPDDSDHGEFA